jgi:chromosome segregation ATPase
MNANEIINALLSTVEIIDDPGNNVVLKMLKGHMTDAADCIESLQAQLTKQDAEISDRERAHIEQHAEVHYWRDKARQVEAQLTESQHRERAAIQDIHICCATCAHCAKPTCPGGKCNFQGYEYWQWRGPQEARP